MKVSVQIVTCMALLGAATPVLATSLGVDNRSNVSGFQELSGVGSNNDPTPLSLTTVKTNPDGRSAVSQTGIRFGLAQVAASASAVTGGGGAGASAKGTWTDFLTVNTPGAGNGILTVRLTLGADIIQPTRLGSINTINFDHLVFVSPIGGLIGSLNTYTYQYTFQGNAGTVFSNYYQENLNGAFNMSNFAFQPSISRTVDLRIPFVSGQAFRIESSTECRVSSIGDVPGCDGSSGSYWAGVRSVTTSGGAALAGWSLSSTSGVDYSGSLGPGVPEPASWLMLIAGFGLVGAARRRQGLAA